MGDETANYANCKEGRRTTKAYCKRRRKHGKWIKSINSARSQIYYGIIVRTLFIMIALSCPIYFKGALLSLLTPLFKHSDCGNTMAVSLHKWCVHNYVSYVCESGTPFCSLPLIQPPGLCLGCCLGYFYSNFCLSSRLQSILGRRGACVWRVRVSRAWRHFLYDYDPLVHGPSLYLVGFPS